MINLAKTPGNVDFQSKYYKQDSSSSGSGAVKSLENRFESVSETESPTSPSHKEKNNVSHHQNVSFITLDHYFILIFIAEKFFCPEK